MVSGDLEYIISHILRSIRIRFKKKLSRNDRTAFEILFLNFLISIDKIVNGKSQENH